MTKMKDEAQTKETLQTAQQDADDEAPKPNRPLGWKQGMGLYRRQKTVEELTRDVGNMLLLLYSTLSLDSDVQSWSRRLNERRDDFERLRRRLVNQ